MGSDDGNALSRHGPLRRAISVLAVFLWGGVFVVSGVSAGCFELHNAPNPQVWLILAWAFTGFHLVEAAIDGRQGGRIRG